MEQEPVTREVKNDIRFRQEKRRCGEKQQCINKCHLEVNPTFVQEQAGILRERFDMARPSEPADGTVQNVLITGNRKSASRGGQPFSIPLSA